MPALEAFLKSDDLSIEMAPMIKEQIAQLKRPAKGKRMPMRKRAGGEEDEDEPGDSNSGEKLAGNSQAAWLPSGSTSWSI